MEFNLTTLGTASALPTNSRYPSAHVLNIRGRLFLIDCGEACQIRLRRMGVSFLKIDHIFISHMHGDHVFGLFGLLSSMAMVGRTSLLNLYAPAAMRRTLDFFLTEFGEGVKFEIAFHSLEAVTEPTVIAPLRNLDILAFPLRHRMPTYGFLFQEHEPEPNLHKELVQQYDLGIYEMACLKRGQDVVREDGTCLRSEDFTYKPWEPRSFAYCSDTAPFPNLPGWVKGVDLLYHESTFAEALQENAATTLHSTARQAATCALEAGVGRLLIGHFSARYPDLSVLLEEARSVFPNTDIAKELTTFEIPLKKHC